MNHEIPTCTTHGIKVSVRSRYHDDVSKPSLGRYIHSYEVSIENLSKYEVQLISRHWIIMDADASTREVTGDGVVGEQPYISPGATHQYTSWCPLETPMGKMSGTYTMIRTDTGSSFEVDIPTFKLIASFTRN